MAATNDPTDEDDLTTEPTNSLIERAPIDKDVRLQVSNIEFMNGSGRYVAENLDLFGEIKYAVQSVTSTDAYCKVNKAGEVYPSPTVLAQLFLQSLEDENGWSIWVKATKRDELPIHTMTITDEACEVDGEMKANAVKDAVAVSTTFGNTSRIASDLPKLEKIVNAREDVDIGVMIVPSDNLAREMAAKTTSFSKVIETRDELDANTKERLAVGTGVSAEEIGFDGVPLVVIGVDFEPPFAEFDQTEQATFTDI